MPTVDDRPTTRDRVLRAAAAVLAADGPSGLTTRRIAAAANVQPPVLYRLFGEKEGLLEALAADAFERFLRSQDRVADPVDPVDALRAGWNDSLRFAADDPGLYRLLQSLSGPAARSRTGRAFAALRSRVAAVAEAGLLAVDEDLAVDLLYAAGNGVIQARMDRPDGLDPRLGDEMLESVLGVILVPSSPQPDGLAAAAGGMLHAMAGGDPPLTPAEQGLLTEWLRRVAGAAAHGSPA